MIRLLALWAGWFVLLGNWPYGRSFVMLKFGTHTVRATDFFYFEVNRFDLLTFIALELEFMAEL